MTIAGLTAPVPLAATHDVEPFECGVPSVDAWLKRHARRNEASGASGSYVVCVGNAVVGYSCPAAGAIDRAEASTPMQRNIPDPIPMMVLGRLAVDWHYQNRGIGSALLWDAVLRVLQVADIAGVKVILVHAISDKAKACYLTKGFLESPIEPTTFYLVLSTARHVPASQGAP